MRKAFPAVLALTTALALSACSEPADTTAASEVAATDIVAEPAAQTDTAILNANTATAEQLAGVSGVSPELAAAIVAGQPYANVTNLDATLRANTSPAEAQTVLTRVFVPVNLNSASKEEIRLIPGMSDKMVHEFEEYRPYADMAEFDREIGKYVDEAEVARLRSYVTL